MTAAENAPAGPIELTALLQQPHGELLTVASGLGIETPPNLAHDELVAAVVSHHLANGVTVRTDGVFEVLPEGFGFVRLLARDFLASVVDAYVSPNQVRSLNLQVGHRLRGPLRAPQGNERFFALTRIEAVQGAVADRLPATVPFADRTALVPTRPLLLADGLLANEPASQPADQHDELRTLQALAPWCHGHRVLVTAAARWPRARLLARLTTGLLQTAQPPHAIVCLLEQRPEDIALVRNQLADGDAQVVATAFAAPPERHLAVATLALASAQRMVEGGHDVVLLLDSLTALVRAAGRIEAPSGAWAHPGLDARALQFAKQLFASARQFGEGGSLTVIATTSIDPDSAIDTFIQREFTAASNSDVAIDPTLAAQELDLQFDLLRTRTRPEDDPRPPDERQRWQQIRNALAELPGEQRVERWLETLHQH